MTKTCITTILSALIILLPIAGCAGEKEPDMTQQNTEHAHTNHLINENSPYLLSHAHNPVNWYPWGEEALARAKAENKPIFLSIGYAACHWCHVMERESFENEAIAEILNQHYIAIKVDREQRPDLDHIYMSFTQALTGRGGWPMSVFLTPDLKPFFAGTYFPPQDIQGHPGFMKVITEIARAWEETEEQITTSSEDIFAQISTALNQSTPPTTLIPSMVDRGVENLMRQVDQVNGGIGTQPKFPHATEHSLFLSHYRKTGDLTYLQAAEKGLMGMARGGIYDQIGGGFARYSTDNRWLVPHFEKMLYDNGLLVPVYTEAWQITKNEYYKKTVIGTLDFILREMTDSSGGFYSALDADSEGEEGKFYVWSEAEIDSVLGGKAEPFKTYMNVTAGGNFEGHNILNIDKNSDRVKEESSLEDFDAYVAECSALLMKARNQRVRPLTDDKILTSWNGLALSALARGYQITNDRRYLEAAVKNAEFVRDVMYHNDSLTHSYREGRRSEGQFLEDYAFYVRGLIDLYESDPSDNNIEWLTFATTLASQAVASFMDDENRFYLRPEDQSDLILRPKDEQDGALPAPGSIMIGNLVRLSSLTGNKQFGETAHNALSALSGLIDQAPNAMSSALVALDHHLNDKIEIVVVGEGSERDRMLATLYAHYIPGRVIAISPSGKNDLPLFEGRADSGEPKAFVCVNSVCALPATSAEELANQLQKL